MRTELKLRKLLKTASKQLSAGDYEKALWRVVDAAGMLQTQTEKGAVGTNGNPTGRGFYIATTQQPHKAPLPEQDFNGYGPKGVPRGGRSLGPGIDICWQDEPLGRGPERKTPNGAEVDGVIDAVIHRIQFYQTSLFVCEEYALALQNLKIARRLLHMRTNNREARRVEGTDNP